MSEDLRRKLRLLQDDYFGQPRVAQQADLREINQIPVVPNSSGRLFGRKSFAGIAIDAEAAVDFER